MNACEYYEERISRMLDQDLSEEEQKELSLHLESCEECRLLYASFSSLSSALAEDLEEVPAHFTAQVMSQVRRDGLRPVRKVKTFRRAAGVLAAAAAAVVLLLAVPQLRSPAARFSLAPVESRTMTADFAEETAETVSYDALPAALSDSAYPEAPVPEPAAAVGDFAADTSVPVPVAEEETGSEVFAVFSSSNAASLPPSAEDDPLSAVFSGLCAVSPEGSPEEDPDDSFELVLSGSGTVVHVYLYGSAVRYTLDDSDDLYEAGVSSEELLELLDAAQGS